MDQHERPYKCQEPTCEQNSGFTYSGGLLRHMREVHKKEVGSPRQPLFCPHTTCIRSTGEGFTRRENLDEHLRRRHSSNNTTDVQSETAAVTDACHTSPEPRLLARKVAVQAASRGPTQPTQFNSVTQNTGMDVAVAEQELEQAQKEIVSNKKIIQENDRVILGLKAQIRALEQPKSMGMAKAAMKIDVRDMRTFPAPVVLTKRWC